jgi:hypothetical protein
VVRDENDARSQINLSFDIILDLIDVMALTWIFFVLNSLFHRIKDDAMQKTITPIFVLSFFFFHSCLQLSEKL